MDVYLVQYIIMHFLLTFPTSFGYFCLCLLSTELTHFYYFLLLPTLSENFTFCNFNGHCGSVYVPLDLVKPLFK